MKMYQIVNIVVVVVVASVFMSFLIALLTSNM
jgi:hypothetical protein